MTKLRKVTRMVLITQGVSRVVMPILQQRDVEVVGIAESAPRGYNPTPHEGTLSRSIVKAVLKRVRQAKCLATVSQAHQLPYFLLHQNNKSDFEFWLKVLHVDLVIIYSMSQLLSRDIFDIPCLGVLNLHPSLLPAYRGPNPWFWMYYDCVKQGGVTLHYIDAGEDTGDIVYQRTYHIPLGIKSPSMQDLAIGQLGCELVLEALKQIGHGNNLPRQTQPTQSSTVRARNIKSSEHSTLIDWTNWSIERIWHLMRGTELWLDCVESPGGVYSGQRWVVDDFERINGSVNDHLLGQVKQDGNGYYVQCREGIIRLHVDLDFYAILRIVVKQFLK